MSTGTKQRFEKARSDARLFKGLFDGCYERWEFAGSLRRKAAEVGDVEHVIIPKYAEMAEGLFTAKKSLLWKRLDELVAAGMMTKHMYGDSQGFRWGEKYRGVDHFGLMHEFYAATVDNFGPTLAIRTGPWEFSRAIVTGLLRKSRRNMDGYVWDCRECPHKNRSFGLMAECSLCDGTGLEPITRLSVPTEQEYFELAGMKWVEPEDRR